MKKSGVVLVAFMVALAAVSCGKVDKYTPYKGAIAGLTKAYETASGAMKKADTKQEIKGIFKSLAAAHEKSSPVIIKYHKMFPELQNVKGEDYPESLDGVLENYVMSMKDFTKIVQTSSNLRPFQNDQEVAAALKEWTDELEQLNKKMNQISKEK